MWAAKLLCDTAGTILGKAYEERRPNCPSFIEPSYFLVQIIDLDDIKDIRKFQPIPLTSLNDNVILLGLREKIARLFQQPQGFI